MSVRSVLAGRHLVLTGATGFLGKVLLATVLLDHPDLRITVIVRTRGRVETAVRRVERMIDTNPCFRPLRARHGAALGRYLAGRLDAVAGDVEKPMCGLDEAALAGLGRCDILVHCAGLTDFAPDPLRALAANTAGAVHAAAVARHLGAALVHVSTAFTCGTPSGSVSEQIRPGISPLGAPFDPATEVRTVIAELRRPDLDLAARVDLATQRARALGWPNVYTYTKGLAEHLLASGRAPASTVIARPSIVECARRTPFAGWNEGLNTAGPLAWLISTAFRELPSNPEAPFDVVPVDDVARGLLVLAASAVRGEAPPVAHLASGDVAPLHLGRTIELTGLAMRKWTRKGHGTSWDRGLFRYLDPVPVPGDGGPWTDPSRLRRWIGHGRSLLADEVGRWIPPALGGGERIAAWDSPLRRWDDELGRVERMLDLYRPFIHDGNWRFETRAMRAASASLEGADGRDRFDVSDIDWRTYWIDVEYVGLRTWCIPLIWGERAEMDPPSVPPLRIAADARERAVAK